MKSPQVCFSPHFFRMYFRVLRHGVFGALALLGSAVCLAAQAARPNILFIYTDDQASWTLGCYGNAQAHTPNLDRLAASGARLDNALVATPVCSPARAALFSGRYGTEVGILDFIAAPGHKEFTPEVGAIGLESRFVLFPELLAKAGYATALVGKWHLGDWTNDPTKRFHPTKRGFEHFVGLTGGGTSTSDPMIERNGVEKKESGLTEDILTSEAMAYLETRDVSRPFFLFLGLRAPHTAYLPVAPEDAAPYRDMEMSIPNPDYPDLNVPDVKKKMRDYLSSVSCIDRNVGRLLGTLEKLKLAENTIVIFSSDHGYNMGHNGIWHKGNGVWATKKLPPAKPNISARYRPNLYDHSLRVPALVRWPGTVKPGTVIGQTVSSLDWYPTLLAMAGVTKPAEVTIRGRDALPLLRGEKPAGWENDFYAEYSMRIYCQTDMRAYRTAEWKLVRDFMNPDRDELYDLRHDPAESRNRIADTSDPAVRQAIATLDAKIRDKMRQLGDPVLAKGGAPK
ncbi:MAG TPA: sulfatase-like hydrolase/transferase [Opitutaceae bacterium]